MRYIFTQVCLFVAVMAGIWLAVPRDVCLTKIVVEGGCVCLAEAGAGSGCVCCAEGKFGNKIACDHSSADTNNQHGEPLKHKPGCFSVSSELSQLTGPERAPDTTPVLDFIALLPFPVDAIVDGRWDFSRQDINSAAADHAFSYRDNCVFLI